MPADPRDPPAFSLSQFEWLVHRRQHEAAGRLLLLGLRRLDERHGALPAGLSEDARAHFLARWAAAIGALFADPGFQVSRDGFEQFLTLQRWLAAIFGATPFGHADHVIAALAGAMPGQGRRTGVEPGRLAQVLRGACRIPNWTCRWTRSGRMTVHRPAGRAPDGHAFGCARRETTLRWLPRKLAQLPDLRGLPTAVLHDAYCIAVMRWRRTSTTSSARSTACCDSGCWPTDSTTSAKAGATLDAGGAGGLLGAAFLYRTHSSTLRGVRRLLHGWRCPGADAVGRFSIVATACRRMRWRRPGRANSGQTSSITQASACAAAGGPAEQSAPGAAAARRRRPSRDHARARHRRHAVEEDALGDAACFSERVVTLPRDCVVHAAARLPGPARRPAWRARIQTRNACASPSARPR